MTTKNIKEGQKVENIKPHSRWIYYIYQVGIIVDITLKILMKLWTNPTIFCVQKAANIFFNDYYTFFLPIIYYYYLTYIFSTLNDSVPAGG